MTSVNDQIKAKMTQMMAKIGEIEDKLSSQDYLEIVNNIRDVYASVDDDEPVVDDLTEQAVQHIQSEENEIDDLTDNEEWIPYNQQDVQVTVTRRYRTRYSHSRHPRRRRNRPRRRRPSSQPMSVVGVIEVRGQLRDVVQTNRGNYKYRQPNGWGYVTQLCRIQFQ